MLYLRNLKGLTHLDLSSNELDGELPSSLSSMLNLGGLYVQQNRLSGQVDELFSNSMAWRIETVNLSKNFLTREFPRKSVILDIFGSSSLFPEKQPTEGASEHQHGHV